MKFTDFPQMFSQGEKKSTQTSAISCNQHFKCLQFRTNSIFISTSTSSGKNKVEIINSNLVIIWIICCTWTCWRSVRLSVIFIIEPKDKVKWKDVQWSAPKEEWRENLVFKSCHCCYFHYPWSNSWIIFTIFVTLSSTSWSSCPSYHV